MKKKRKDKRDVEGRVWCNPSEYRSLQKAAARDNRSFSSWLRLLGLAEAKRA